MNIDKEATDLLQSKILKVRPERYYSSGELLKVLKDSHALDYMRNKFRIIVGGYPARSGSPLIHVNKILENGTPFMFLGWAAYSKEHKIFLQNTEKQELRIIKNEFTNSPEYLFGMNILVADKVFLLTCGFSYSFNAMNNYPQHTFFVRDVLSRIVRPS